MLKKVLKSKFQIYFSNQMSFSTTANPSENDIRFKQMLNSIRPVIDNLTKNEENNKKELKEKLSSEKKAHIELLADKFGSMNEFQLNLYNILLKEHLMKSKKQTVIEVNTAWSKLAQMGDKAPNINPAFFQQQEFMAKFVKWLANQPKADLGLGLSTVQAAPVQKKEEVVEKKEEKKEKAAYDIELSSFDAAKKIALIKEVRAFTNLGLKETKELVEKAPTVIMKGVKKEDTEAIIKKLTESGAKITLK